MNFPTALPIGIELLAKSALISVAAVLLVKGWRGATAAQRHLVWLVALATVMLLPCTRLFAPFWKIPLAPAKKTPVVVTVPLPANTAPLEVAAPGDEPAAAAPVRRPFDWPLVVLGVWGGGAALLLGYRLFGSWRLHRLNRRSVAVDDARVRLLLSRTMSELGLRRRPEIRLSGECRVPITWGTLRPVMLLPQQALEWNDVWLTAALRHEAAHIVRHDSLTRWIAQMACALYWPNPFVWLAIRALRLAQEQAADDLVLRAGTPADEYATQLVDAARAVATHGLFVRHAVAMACPSTLEDRVRAIIDGHRDRRPLSRVAAACGSLTIALALALSTAAQLRSENEAPKPSPIPEASGTKSPAAPGPQIEIDARFVEIDPRIPQEAVPVSDKPTIYSDPQFQLIVRALNQKKGVDLLTAPTVTTRPNQRTTMELIREFRSPIDWEKDGKMWKPTKFESKNVGTTLEVEPQLKEDGTIELRAIATVVEFLGFLDLDAGKPVPASKTAPGEMMKIPPVAPGHRAKAIFSERKQETTVTLHSEETVAFPALPETSEVKPFEKSAHRRDVIVFISSRIINPAPAKEAPKEGAATTTPAHPDSTAVITVDKSGSVKLNGEPVSIDDLKTRLRALRASDPGSDVVVRGDADTPHKAIMDLLDGIRSAGITNAALVLSSVVEFEGFIYYGSPISSTKPPDSLLTKEWKIPPDMIPAKPGTDGPERVSAKDWLISKGITFEGAASGTYVLANSRLIVRNTLEQLERIDHLVAAGTGAEGSAPAAGTSSGNLNVAGSTTLYITGVNTLSLNEGAKPAAPPDSPVLAKAEKIIIPDFELREATLVDALDALRKQAVEFDPDKTGVKIVLKPGAPSDARITVSLHTIPVVEALKYVTGLANLEFVATPEALVVQPMGAGKASPEPTPKGTGQQEITVTGGTLVWNGPAPAPAPASGLTLTLDASTTASAAVDGPALAKAKKIIIPKIELREATLAEALDFLRKKAVELDPDETGVNLVLKPGAVSDAQITVSLTNIPLIEAVAYVAGLANLELVVKPDALGLQPPNKGAAKAADHLPTVASNPDPEDIVESAAKPKRAPVAGSAPAPEIDAGDLFLTAYMAMQKSAKLEADAKIQEAIQQMQLADQRLDEVRKLYPTWQPDMVDYRKKLAGDALQRLQGKR